MKLDEANLSPLPATIFPTLGKRSLAVMERLNYATARQPCLVGWRVGAGATAWGCGLFRFAPRWMASVAGAWAVGIGFTAFSLGIVGMQWRTDYESLTAVGQVVIASNHKAQKQTWGVRHESYDRTSGKGYTIHI